MASWCFIRYCSFNKPPENLVNYAEQTSNFWWNKFKQKNVCSSFRSYTNVYPYTCVYKKIKGYSMCHHCVMAMHGRKCSHIVYNRIKEKQINEQNMVGYEKYRE